MLTVEHEAEKNTRAVQLLLEEWAKWSRENSGRAKGYSPAIPTERLRGSSIKASLLTDAEGERVDGAVTKLGQRCPDQGAVLRLYYLNGLSLAKIGNTPIPVFYSRFAPATRATRRVGRQAATVLLRQAETAVEWILE